MVRDSANSRTSPSGHLDAGESVVAEATREARMRKPVPLSKFAIWPLAMSFITATPKARLVSAVSLPQPAGVVSPSIASQANARACAGFDPARPPASTRPYTAAALSQITQGTAFSLDGW